MQQRPSRGQRAVTGQTTNGREELEATPPGQFVRARNALAARLRKAGRAREAAEVARLRRPSPVVWAVNRLARTDAANVRRLLEASDRLRRASLRDPRAVPEATARHRAALQELAQQAAGILSGAGLRASPEVLRRIHATLSAAAGDRDAHAALREGRLAEELQPSGFEVLGDVPARHLRLVKPAETAAPPPARRDRARERQERAERQAAERRAKAERRAAQKEKAAAARREREIERASRQAERLRAELRKVEERLRYARDAHERPTDRRERRSLDGRTR